MHYILIVNSEIEEKVDAMSATLKESPAMQTKKIMQRNVNYNQDREQYQEALDSAQKNFELVSPVAH